LQSPDESRTARYFFAPNDMMTLVEAPVSGDAGGARRAEGGIAKRETGFGVRERRARIARNDL